MKAEVDLRIEHHDFSPSVFEALQSNHFAKNLWPIVYILSDENQREAYVGETTDTFKRLETHLKSDQKKKLTTVHLINSSQFNKSATLDIESNLIKYMSGDGQYKLLNGNLGLANHNYYQKEKVYWSKFESIWNQLIAQGLAKHSIDHINNSDLFKYSPFKSLKQDQLVSLKNILKYLLNDSYSAAVIEGGAGTGKTILATFLFKLLATDNQDFNYKDFGEEEKEFLDLVTSIKAKFPDPKMALVVPMSSFRSTLKKIFKNIKGLRASMVIGPAEVSREKYDILLVDESHRLRKKKSIGAYIGAFNKAAKRLGLDPDQSNELEWVTMQSEKPILFYDEDQSIKPSDVNVEDFRKLKKQSSTYVFQLKSQFRVKGGNDYVDFVDKLLNVKHDQPASKFASNTYEFVLYDSVSKMVDAIKARDQESGLSRVVAGFSWDWVSNKEGSEHLSDIKIGDAELKWNNTTSDWINSENAVNEVGCIHTTQGYDLNYAGIIFGNEISYDAEKDEIIILKEHYVDPTGRQADSLEELKNYIVNIYKTMMLRGIKGTYLYACDPALREYLRKFVPEVRSKKAEKEIRQLSPDEVKPFENSIPIYKLNAAAGEFSDKQSVEELDWIELPEGLRPSTDLFACRIVGESMNQIIPNGSICLFRKDRGGSRNGKIVLVEHTEIQDPDFGSCYTVKEYESKKYQDEEGWKHEAISLKPKSTDSSYETLILKDDELEQFKVIGIFERVL